jgi:hypothetical protein
MRQKFSDSHIIEVDGIINVEVHFERPTEEGFDMARCILPNYSWSMREGFSDEEIATFEQFLMSNAHLLYKYARSGGEFDQRLFLNNRNNLF